MRNYQICEMSIMLFNLPVSWLMLHLKLPLYSVFITMSVIEFVNLIAIMVLAYKELGFMIGDYIKKVIVPSVFIICINGYFNISDIECAVMETDGRLSFLPKPELRPACPNDLGLSPAKEGLVSNVIIDGKIMPKALQFCGLDKNWLQKQLSDQKIQDVSQILLGTVDVNGLFTAFMKNMPPIKYNPFN